MFSRDCRFLSRYLSLNFVVKKHIEILSQPIDCRTNVHFPDDRSVTSIWSALLISLMLRYRLELLHKSAAKQIISDVRWVSLPYYIMSWNAWPNCDFKLYSSRYKAIHLNLCTFNGIILVNSSLITLPI